MSIQESLITTAAATPSRRDPLGALAALVPYLMLGKTSAEIIHRVLERLETIAAYDHAWLEVVSADPSAVQLVLHITPQTIVPVLPASVLVEEGARLFPITAAGRELGCLRVMPAHERMAPEENSALEALCGYLGLAIRLAALEAGEAGARKPGELEIAPRRAVSVANAEPAKPRLPRVSSLQAELSQILSAQLGMSILCDRVLERLLSMLSVEAGALFVYEARGGDLQRIAQRGAPGPMPARLVIDRTAPAALGRAAAAATPYLELDIFAADVQMESSEDRLLRTWGFHSLLCFPLFSGKRLIGGLQLMSRRTDVLGNEALSLLGAVSEELSLALQNASTFDRLSTMIVTDELTGLHNRRFCEEFARKQVLAAQRSHRHCALLLIDVDQLREFNDRSGHAAGDAALQGVAASLLGSIRAADLGGRYGGEEFIVILPNADLATAMTVAERIRVGAMQTAIPANGRFEQVTVSIGVTAFPECAENLSQLFNSADVALFAAKESGSNRLVMAPLIAVSAPPSGSAR